MKTQNENRIMIYISSTKFKYSLKMKRRALNAAVAEANLQRQGSKELEFHESLAIS